MIGKVTRGSGFGGLQAYLLRGKDGDGPDRVAWVAVRNLPSDDPELAARVMRATARENVRIERPVYHLTLSHSPDQHLDHDAVVAVADRTLRDLGLQEHQVLIVAHDDTEHQHVHLMINRVHPETGRAWHTGHDYARIEKSLRLQERELGLREVAGRHYALPGQERHRGVELSSGERRIASRTGERPFGEHVQEVARTDLQEARSWDELHGRLADYGLRLEKRGRGLVLTDGESRVKASYVDRKSSLRGLEERLGRYRPAGRDHFPAGKSERWRDLHELRRTADALVRARDAEREARRAAGVRVGDQKAARERVRLERRVEAAEARLDASFSRAYRDPGAARRRFDALRRSRGDAAAAREVAAQPQRFGQLRGRGGPVVSPARRRAVDAARRGASAARDLAVAQASLARHLAGRGVVGKVAALARATTATRSKGAGQIKSSADLTKSALQLVNRLGWKVVARAIPVPHFQVLRLTLSLGKKVLENSLDIAKEARR